MPRSRKASATSMSVTSKPDAAAVWAIPFPIVPAPMTTMCFMGPPKRRGGYHVAATREAGVRSPVQRSVHGPKVLHVRCGDSAGNPLREVRQAAQTEAIGRNNGIMGAIAKQFSNNELKALASYVGSQDSELAVHRESRFR